MEPEQDPCKRNESPAEVANMTLTGSKMELAEHTEPNRNEIGVKATVIGLSAYVYLIHGTASISSCFKDIKVESAEPWAKSISKETIGFP